MSQEEIIAHWWKGSHDALRAAKLLFEDANYELALFHCHLCIEKALKALHITHQKNAPPPTHDLYLLGIDLPIDWSEEQKRMLTDLTKFAIEARYTDPVWSEHRASKEYVQEWIKRIETLFTTLQS